MKIKLNDLNLFLSHLIEAIKASQVKPVILLNGPTGIGKTATIRQLAEKLNYELIDVRLSRELPENIGGIPYTENEDSEFFIKKLHIKFKPAFEKPCILFFDEFNRANHYVQNSIMSLLYERELEGKILHPDTVIILAINTGSDYVATEQLDKAFLARCIILNIVPDSFSDSLREYFTNNYNTANLVLVKEDELIKIIDSDIEELLPTKTLRNLEFALIILDYALKNNIEKAILDKLLLTAVHPDVFTILNSSLLNFEVIKKIIAGKNIKIKPEELNSIMLMLSFYSYKNTQEMENAIKFCLKQLEEIGYEDLIIPVLKNIKEKNTELYIELITENREIEQKILKILEKISKN
ncbi:MAG: MoxR family ATPase [Candidatus Pacearchaeota archaeon]